MAEQVEQKKKVVDEKEEKEQESWLIQRFYMVDMTVQEGHGLLEHLPSLVKFIKNTP